jgi:hypothetical protein
MYRSTLSLILALDGVGGLRHTLANLPSGKRPIIHFIGARWAKGWLGCVWKISLLLGFDLQTVQPVASLSTTGHAILSHSV